MTSFVARDYLPDWFMLGCAFLFILIPAYASFYKHENNAWKSRAFAASWLMLVLLFFLQGVDAPVINDIQVRALLGRLGILAVGFSGCILALNGLNNHLIARLLRTLRRAPRDSAAGSSSPSDPIERKAVE